MLSFDVVIVGAGHGGAQSAIALRQAGFDGSIAIIGEEPDLPYERPPLSKEYLTGTKPFERLLIRKADFWAERSVVMLLRRRVEHVDAIDRVVVTAVGERVGYRHLIWAAGGQARRLSCAGGTLAGVHTLRTRVDADSLKAELPGAARVVVIGGGYVGLEAAAACVAAGKRVVLVEALDRVLARVAGVPLSRFFEAEHRAHGVDVRLGTKVAGLEGHDRVSGVRLTTGELVPADLIVVGIGIEPITGPLLAAGATGGNGVAVDAQCRTSLPDVFAVGDCALHSNAFADGQAVRLESVQNAHDQATVAAQTIMGLEVRYDAVPWFWSNQYDLKLQTVGLSTGHDDVVVRGDPAMRSFSVIYRKAGRVVALDCVNATRDYVQGRRLVAERRSPDPAQLADASVPLKDLT